MAEVVPDVPLMQVFKGLTCGFVTPPCDGATVAQFASLYAVTVTAVATQRRLTTAARIARYFMFENENAQQVL